MATRAIPVALPAPEPTERAQPGARPGAAPSGRPLAGPVVPLTASSGAASDALLGAEAAPPSTVDPVATRVLTKGEPTAGPIGRADDFGWPRNTIATEPVGPTPSVATPQRPRASQAAATPAAGAADQNANPTQPRRRVRTNATSDPPPRPPLGINPFNLFAPRGGAH